MANTSASELAARLLDASLNAREWDHTDAVSLARAALSEDHFTARTATLSLFRDLVEPLADRFDPQLAEAYARIFSHVLSTAIPELRAPNLIDHYHHARLPRPPAAEPSTVVVLSRVTLGADVAVTSLFLNAAKRRFPAARIVFASPQKPWELFERDPRLTHFPIDYPRTATLAQRLACFHSLRTLCSEPSTLLLDPDSRLSQLGLLPLAPPGRHHLFDSRSAGGDSLEPLPTLAALWLSSTLGVEDPEPYLHPKFHFDFGSTPTVTASFGVGENPSKRIGDLFEESIAAHLAALPAQVFIDAGAPGSEEEARVRRAIEAAGPDAERIGVHVGPFSSFAAMIAASGLYFGYDSAGQHVAAALGVPAVSVFNGAVNRRMLARWTPTGPGPITVLDASRFHDAQDLLSTAISALKL